MHCSTADQPTVDVLQKKFNETYGLKFNTDDETECSCDDCHHRNYSSSGGCRRLRTRND